MVRLSARSEYALLALLDLARHHGEGPQTTAALAERNGIPQPYLEQILGTLRKAGYVRSRRGPGGGQTLAREPGAISVAEVLRLLDGALAPVESVSEYFYEETAISRSDALLSLFRRIRDHVAAVLEGTTLADLTGGPARGLDISDPGSRE